MFPIFQCECCAFVLMLNIIFGEDFTCPRDLLVPIGFLGQRVPWVPHGRMLELMVLCAKRFHKSSNPLIATIFHGKRVPNVLHVNVIGGFKETLHPKLLPYKHGWMLIIDQDAWLEGSTLNFESNLWKAQCWICDLSNSPRKLWLQSTHIVDSFLPGFLICYISTLPIGVLYECT